jgi:hypothetical protein
MGGVTAGRSRDDRRSSSPKKATYPLRSQERKWRDKLLKNLHIIKHTQVIIKGKLCG